MASRIFYFLLTLLGLALFISLGCWQLHRAEEKRQLIASYKMHSQAPYLALADINNDANLADLHFRQLSVNGYFDSKKQFLLDNRFVNHQLGYHVLTSLQIPLQKKRLLIDRGWIPRSEHYNQLPSFETPQSFTHVVGFIDFFPKKVFQLNEQENNPGKWPRIIENLDFKKIEKILGEPLYPFVIKLHPLVAHGFVRHWSRVTTMPPERHVAYAIQWFAFAAATLVIFLLLNFRKR